MIAVLRDVQSTHLDYWWNLRGYGLNSTVSHIAFIAFMDYNTWVLMPS